MNPARLHIVGRKNHGKTSLVADLVAELVRRGYRVGTVKHTHHPHPVDQPGKDSDRHRRAGAAVAALVTPDGLGIFLAPPPDPYRFLAERFPELDLLLVEGDPQARAPRLEVWRAAAGGRPLAAEGLEVVAVVTDDPVSLPVPRWPRRDVALLCDHLLAALGLTPGRVV